MFLLDFLGILYTKGKYLAQISYRLLIITTATMQPTVYVNAVTVHQTLADPDPQLASIILYAHPIRLGG